MIKARLKAAVQGALASRGLKITHNRFDLWTPDINILDLIVRDRFAAEAPKYLIQIGANDGTTDDPVHDLILRYSMRAVVVEPLPDCYARLCEAYAGAPNVSTVNAAIAATDGECQLYRVDPSNERLAGMSVLASFDRSIIENQCRNLREEGASIIAVRVPAMSPRSLLDRYEMPRVDVLQVDTEGFDAEVVTMFIDAKCRPAIIAYEHSHLDSKADAKCLELLRREGYRLVRVGRDTIAVRG